jgi:hypothetical protein
MGSNLKTARYLNGDSIIFKRQTDMGISIRCCDGLHIIQRLKTNGFMVVYITGMR